ncbi:MAG: hypothetical protein WKF41_12940 [Gaiellaceae bacterium]
MIRRLLHTECRCDDIKGLARKRQRFRITDEKLDIDAVFDCFTPRTLDQPRRNVDSCDMRAERRRADRHSPRAGSDIDPAVSGSWCKKTNEVIVHRRDPRGDLLPRRLVPSGALTTSSLE